MSIHVKEKNSMAVRALRTVDASTNPEATVEIVTPEIAADWLARPGSNRPISHLAVTRYAAEMERGEWQMTGEAIKFDARGQLIDGQHRLSAIVQADVTLPLLIARGIEPAAFDVMDSGRKRTAADVLAMHGYAQPIRLAAAVRAVLLFRRYGNFHARGVGRSTYAPSKPEILCFIEENPRIHDAVRETNVRALTFPGTPPGVLGATWFLFDEVDGEDCVGFFNALKTGADLSATNPVHLLRNRLIENSKATSRTDPNIIGALIIKAWNAWRAGNEMRLLTYRPGGSSPEPYPAIQ